MVFWEDYNIELLAVGLRVWQRVDPGGTEGGVMCAVLWDGMVACVSDPAELIQQLLA